MNGLPLVVELDPDLTVPEAWQRFGMEWLYRLLQEPRRLWRRYLVTNTVFCGMVLAEMFGRGKPGSTTAPARESRVG